jgi:hypothetical protein
MSSGSTHASATRGVWGSGNGVTTGTDQTNITETNGATFQVGNVKAELGTVPTPYVKPSLSTEMSGARLGRFYRKTFAPGTAPASNLGNQVGALCAVASSTTAGTIWARLDLSPPMNSAPMLVTLNPGAANQHWRNITGAADAVVLADPFTSNSAASVTIGEQTTALAVGSKYCIQATLNARL